MQTREIWFISLAVGVIVAGFLYPLHPDEKVFFEIAQGISRGELPYIDFADNKPPGLYYLLALATQFPVNLLIAARVLVVISNLMSAFWLWKLSGDQLLVLSLLILLPAYQGQFALTEVFMLPWLLAAAYSLLKKQIFLTGILLGMAFIWKQSALIQVIATLIWLASVSGRGVGRFLSGFSLIFLVVYGLLSLHMPVSTWWYYVFESLLTTYPPHPLGLTLQKLPSLLIPLGIFIVLILYSFFIRYTKNRLSLYSIINILIGITILLFRPYHHYWIQFLPYLLLTAFSTPLYMYMKTLLTWQLYMWGIFIVLYPLLPL